MEPSNDQNSQTPTNQLAPQLFPEQPMPPEVPTSQPLPEQSQPAFQNQDSVVGDNSKKPSKKTTIVLVIILAILVIAGIGFGIWMAINGNQKPAENPPVTPVEPSEEEKPSEEEPSEEESTVEEVELTDANIIKDLDQKIAYLHIIDDAAPTFETMRGHNESPLYRQNPLSEDYKQFVTEISLTGQYRPANNEEIAVLKANYPDYDFDSWNQPGTYTEVIDGNAYASRYTDLFGKEPDYDIVPIDPCRPSFQYDKTTNLMFEKPNGCGDGASATVTYFSKNKYTTTGENVYVYTNAVTVDYETGNVYCSAMYWWGESAPESCGTINPTDYPTATYETFKEYGDRTTYRFTFKKALDGTYYFDKVEKVST